MRILIIGFFVFLIWAAFSTYIYIEKINVECNVAEAPQTLVDHESQPVMDTMEHVMVVPIRLPEDVIIHFEYKSSSFETDSSLVMKLEEFVNYLTETDSARVTVSGFTDNIGSYEYNMMLGQDRADAVGKWMTSHGVDPNRLIITSEGEEMPVGDNETEAGREMNRRVIVTLKQ